MSAGGVALRLLAKLRAYRACDPEYRRLARPERPAEKRDSRGDASARSLESGSGRATLHCKKACGGEITHRRMDCFPGIGLDSLAAVRCHTADPCAGYRVQVCSDNLG